MDFPQDVLTFIVEEQEKFAGRDGYFINWRNFDILSYARENYFWLCRRDGEPVGFMLARLAPSVFDPTVIILTQDALYVKEIDGFNRAAHLLIRELVDFGKLNATLIFTMLTKSTNIKGQTLEKLGFVQGEVSYELGVGRVEEANKSST